MSSPTAHDPVNRTGSSETVEANFIIDKKYKKILQYALAFISSAAIILATFNILSKNDTNVAVNILSSNKTV
jgi:hypothetical protein